MDKDITMNNSLSGHLLLSKFGSSNKNSNNDPSSSLSHFTQKNSTKHTYKKKNNHVISNKQYKIKKKSCIKNTSRNHLKVEIKKHCDTDFSKNMVILNEPSEIDNNNNFTRMTRANKRSIMQMQEILPMNDYNLSIHMCKMNKYISIGENFQAKVPNFMLGIVKSNNSSSYIDNEEHIKYIDPSTIPDRNDELIWNPRICSNQQVEKYMKKICRIESYDLYHSKPYPIYKLANIADNEPALYHLMKNKGNVKKALSSKQNLTNFLISDTLQHMSSNDCVLFELGMNKFYKDFEKIHSHYLPHKKITQLIEYFYFWKKNSRYDNLKKHKCHFKGDLTISQSCFMSSTIDKLNLPYYLNADGGYSLIPYSIDLSLNSSINDQKNNKT